jgi:hypothetical protein
MKKNSEHKEHIDAAVFVFFGVLLIGFPTLTKFTLVLLVFASFEFI